MMQIVYYDGQFDDARLNVTLAISAAQAGATTLNYCTVTSLIKVQKPPPPPPGGCLNQESALCHQVSGGLLALLSIAQLDLTTYGSERMRPGQSRDCVAEEHKV